MKKLLILALTIISFTSNAQDRKEGKKMNVQELATKQTEKMTSSLGLDEAQAKQVYELNLEQAKKRVANRATRKNKKEEGQAAKNNGINRKDKRIARQNKMRQILSEEQFDLWIKKEKRGKKRGKKRSKKRKGNQ